MLNRPKSMRSDVRQRVLQRAVEACGGVERMSAFLNLPPSLLDVWLRGDEPIPSHIFLQAVDCVLEGKSCGCVEVASGAVVDRRPLLLLPVVRDLAKDALADALALHRTGLGNVQLLNPAGKLEIVAQSGFEREFLEFFREVSIESSSACGAALKNGRQMIVDDVCNDAIFAGTPAVEIMLRAGAYSVQSTPVAAASGRIFGIISTHFSSIGGASGLPSLQPICRWLADTLDKLELAG